MKRVDLLLPRRALLSAGAATLVSACASLIPGSGPPPRLYTLTPKSTFSPNLPKVEWQLVLEVPFASSALNTTRIGIITNHTNFDYYANAAWTDRAPQMVQTLMIESFENSRKIVSVGRESIGLRADYVLKTELREFQAEISQEGDARVRVAVNAKLVRMPQREIVAAIDVGEVAPTSPDEMDKVIQAFDEASGKVLRKLVEWTLTEGERFRPARPA
jgi:cholesterol transport system auxiliary component